MSTPPFLAHKCSAMLSPAHVNADTCNHASCVICAFILCVFWSCSRPVVVDGFAQGEPARLYNNRKFNVLHCFSLKVAGLLDQGDLLCVGMYELPFGRRLFSC